VESAEAPKLLAKPLKHERHHGKKHYSSLHRNQQDQVAEILKPQAANENSSTAANQRTPKKETPYDEQPSSEYKRTICLSAERAPQPTKPAGASNRKRNLMS